jgi:hypothetical protein
MVIEETLVPSGASIASKRLLQNAQAALRQLRIKWAIERMFGKLKNWKRLRRDTIGSPPTTLPQSPRCSCNPMAQMSPLLALTRGELDAICRQFLLNNGNILRMLIVEMQLSIAKRLPWFEM